jgi:response regulator of citrate/malate metabolism
MIRTMIVEDDFRVARLHAEVVDALDGFTVVATVHTASAALDGVRHHAPQLVLLDLFLPDVNGLEVLRRLQTLPAPADVIVLSAAREMHSVRAAMQRGALHYLIKPFDFDDLRLRLAAYAELDAARSAERETHQQEVDHLFDLIRRPLGTAAITLPKGHSAATAQLVLEALSAADEALSASDVSQRVGISRATAQRYLTSLADAGKIRLNLRYGTAGRPEHRYEPEPP